MRALFAIACASALGACTLLDSLDGYSEPFPPDGGDDAAPFDAPATDVTEAEAGPDVTIPFCQTQDATFCDDFERTEDALQGNWSAREQNNADLRLDAGALVIRIPSGSKSGTNAQLRRAIGVGDHVIYEFDLTVLSFPDSGSMQVNNLYVAYDGDERAYVSLLADRFGFHSADQIFPDGSVGTFNAHDLTKIPKVGATTHVRYELSLSATSTSFVTITFDGSTVYTGPLDPLFKPGVISVNAGVDYTQGPTSGLEFRVDNVVVKP